MMFELTARELIAEIFLAGGAFFLLASAIGMLRLPDFYCRLHASGNSETLLLISLLIVLGNPIGTHILSKAAYKSGHHVWTLEEDAKEDKEDADLHH